MSACATAHPRTPTRRSRASAPSHSSAGHGEEQRREGVDQAPARPVARPGHGSSCEEAHAQGRRATADRRGSSSAIQPEAARQDKVRVDCRSAEGLTMRVQWQCGTFRSFFSGKVSFLLGRQTRQANRHSTAQLSPKGAFSSVKRRLLTWTVID